MCRALHLSFSTTNFEYSKSQTNYLPVVADFNHDNSLDIAVYVPGALVVLSGRGNGTFATSKYQSPPYDSGPTAAIDVDGDGWLDLPVLAFNNRQLQKEDYLYVARGGPASFTLGPSAVFEVGATGNTLLMVAADLNGDGRSDLISQRGSWLRTALDVGGAIQSPATRTPDEVVMDRQILTGDFDGDGHPDLIGRGMTTAFLRGRGDGTFEKPDILATGNRQHSLVAGDFDEDGFPDVAGADISKGGLVLWSPRKSMDFASAGPQFQLWTGAPTASPPAADDFDLDGHVDIAAPQNDDSPPALLKICRGNGAGVFGLPLSFTIDGAQRTFPGVFSGDFNRDGKPDILLTTYDRGYYLMLNTSD